MAQKRWFRAKRYGWGWYPSAWQGWALLATYFAIVIGAAILLLPHKGDLAAGYYAMFGLFTMSATLILVGICYKTGEEPHWRWGGDADGDTKK